MPFTPPPSLPFPPRSVLLWLTHGLCWFHGSYPATTWVLDHHQGWIPTCGHCKRQKGKKSLDQFRLWLEEGPFWGETIGLTLPLFEHYNPDDWKV